MIGGFGLKPLVSLSLAGRRLLAYLAIKSHAVSRAVAASELWLDVSDDCARANLRRALWHLPRGWVVSVGEDLHLDATSDLADAQAIAIRALQGESLSLQEIRLLREDLLPGWHDEWAMSAQEDFRLLRVQALEAACRTMSGAGQLALATQAGAAALAAEPLCESAADALIGAHLAQGNRFEAVQCFRALAARLEAELGVGPSDLIFERIAALEPLVRMGAADGPASELDELRTLDGRPLSNSQTR